VVSLNANGANVAYAWDQDNRLQNVTDDRTGGVTSYTYDQTDQLWTMQYANHATHTFSYDSRGRTYWAEFERSRRIIGDLYADL
jgi:uncharacterized protein RhaS with RHS repeats